MTNSTSRHVSQSCDRIIVRRMWL